jgi:UDP-N-acetylglucosamine/UDP-N-acetylgalactosamine diphosphorylase
MYLNDCLHYVLCCSHVQAYPQEKVGVFVQRGRGGPLSVVEYSEMDAAMTTEINQTTGRLRYCWSNV